MKVIIFLILFSVSIGFSMDLAYSENQANYPESQPFCVPTPTECIYSCPQKRARWELNKKVCSDSLMPILCTCIYSDELSN